MTDLQIWNWNNFLGGEGDGYYYGPPGSYRIGMNMDTRMVENGARLSSAFIEQQTYSGDITAINPYGPKSFITTDGTNGQLYYNGSSTISISGVTPAYNKVYGFGTMIKTPGNTEYIYGFTGISGGVGNIHRIDNNFGGATFNIKSRTLAKGRQFTSLNNKLVTLSLGDRIIFGYGNTIYEIDNAETVTQLLELPYRADVVAITNYQDTFKVYYNVTKVNSTEYDGYIGAWDGLSNTFDQIVRYENSGIKDIINNGPNDYAIFGYIGSDSTSDLYIIQGLQRQQLRVNVENGVANTNTRTLSKFAGIREGILYLVGNDKLLNNTLWSYGTYYTGTGVSLTSENIGYNFTAFNVRNNTFDLYSDDAGGTNIGKLYQKSFNFNTNCNTNGLIYSYPLVGNNGIYTQKTIKRVYIGYTMVHQNDSIKLYARKDGGPYTNNATGWTLIKNITGINYLSKRGIRIDEIELKVLGLGDFYQLEYKIDITAGSTTTPILHIIRTHYFDNLKD